MRGIYKITSPSGKVYIGQSTNIRVRFYNYRKCDSCKKQRILYSSFLKYGIDAHVFEVVYELPNDCDAVVMANYEQFFMDQFREAGYSMMNLKEAGPHGGHSEETKRKLSVAHMGRPKSKEAVAKQAASMKGKPSSRKGKTHSEAVREKIREKRALQTNVYKRPKGSIPWNKGLKGLTSAWNKGLTGVLSEETKAAISQALKGRKLSPESIKKREETRKKNGSKGYNRSPESIEKMRQSKIGKKASIETRLKMSMAGKARYQSKATAYEPH